MIQVYFGKTATTLKANATVAYPVHIVLLNFTKEYRRFFIENWYTLVRLSPIFASKCNEAGFDNETIDGYYRYEEERVIPVNDELHQPPKRHGRDTEMEILQGALQRILKPLSTAMKSWFEVLPSTRFWKFCPVVVSYFCDLLESKEMPRVKNDRKSLSCVRDMSTWDDIYALKSGIVLYWINKETWKNEADQMQKEKEFLLKNRHRWKTHKTKAWVMNSSNECSLNRQNRVIFKLKLTIESCFNDSYSTFKLAPFHFPFLGIFKIIMECTAAYLASTRQKWKTLPTPRQQMRKANLFKSTRLNRCNKLLLPYEKDFTTPDVPFDFSR